MPKNKKNTNRKKAARRGVAAGVATASTALNTIVISSQSSPDQLQKWASASALMDSSLPGTSMQQLALNTRNKTSHWDQNSSLRVRPVTFVSGGFDKPSEEADGSDDPQSSKTAATLPSTTSYKSTSLQDITALEAKADPTSSDEEILFKGRVALQKPHQIAKANNESLAQQATAVARASPPPAIVLFDPPGISGLDLLISDSGEESGSDAAINDYIDNMSSEDMTYLTQRFTANRRELGDPKNDVVIGISSSGAESGYERYADTGDSSTDECDQADKLDSASATRELLKLKKTNCRLHHIHNARQRTNENSNFNDSPVKRQLAADTNGNLSSLLDKYKAPVIDGDNLSLSDTNSSQCVTAHHGQSDKQCKRSKRLPAWQATFNFTKDYRAARGTYPSAEAVADAFEQLDVTGWGRNSNEFHLHLSDSELETTLRKSWQKDRMRKKEKRKARDELRSQGLLKKNANLNDSRIKYPNGMSLDELKAEFYLFLSGSDKSVTLPPMDAAARKVVHEIAHRFQIASKSTGSGDQRRPTLIRKKATLRLDEALFSSVFARYQRRFFARLDANKAEAVFGKKTKGRNGGDPGAAMVRNGEVVGGSAPEIGVQNKGRTMLEKMGWSTGMALGAMDNKGMTQIIEHVVKRSKAGLG